MEILHEKSIFPQQASLILGFFDGIHAGHRDVLKNTPENKKVVVTFSSSPAEYFKQDFCYIYPREFNYSLIKSLGVDYIYEQNFTDIAHLSAEEYLAKLISKFNVKKIETIATDGIAPQMQEYVNNFDDEEFDLYIDYHLKNCMRRELLGYSSHILEIVEKI